MPPSDEHDILATDEHDLGLDDEHHEIDADDEHHGLIDEHDLDDWDDEHHADDGGDHGGGSDDDGHGGGDGPHEPRFLAFCRRHKILTGIAIVLLPLFLLVSVTWVQAMTKEGSESFTARNVEWLRDMHMGFLVDRVEQKYYEDNQPPSGGKPEDAIGPAANQPQEKESSTTTGKAAVKLPDHLTPPQKMKTPAAEPIPNEGDWFPAGPDVGGGLHPMYYTKVRPNNEKTSLLVFVAWMDPKLAQLKLFPGTELPGGKWSTPPYIPAEQCPNLLAAFNSGFRMDQARGGYYQEGREQVKLRDGSASMIFYKDGTVNVGQWGRDATAADLPKIDAVRQNLELLVDNGAPVPDLDKKDWGALLKNVYFVWRSAFGVTKDGAVVFVGGPALQPRDLANRLIDAGAVRGMEMDINPEWVTANLYNVAPDGSCQGTKGLDGSEDKGGQRQPANRYLKTDTRDFVAVFTKPQTQP